MRQQGSQLGTELDIALLFRRQKKFQSFHRLRNCTHLSPSNDWLKGLHVAPWVFIDTLPHKKTLITTTPPPHPSTAFDLNDLFREAPLRSNLGQSRLQFLLTSVHRSPGCPLSHVKRSKIRGFAFPLQGWWHRQHACRCCESFAPPHYQGIA